MAPASLHSGLAADRYLIDKCLERLPEAELEMGKGTVLRTRVRPRTLVELGGVSFAGSRGIGAVRVRANRGLWEPARLEAPLPPHTWTRWIA